MVRRLAVSICCLAPAWAAPFDDVEALVQKSLRPSLASGATDATANGWAVREPEHRRVYTEEEIEEKLRYLDAAYVLPSVDEETLKHLPSSDEQRSVDERQLSEELSQLPPTVQGIPALFANHLCRFRYIFNLSQANAEFRGGINSFKAQNHGPSPKPYWDVDSESVTVGYAGVKATYKYMGPYFGCAHVDQRYFWLRTGEWADHKLRETLKGVDPDGNASRRIDDLNIVDFSEYKPLRSRGSKSALGGPSGIADQFIAAALQDKTSTNVLVLHRGELAEGHAEGFETMPVEGASTGKSILSLLVGIRQAEGKLDLSSYGKAPELSEEQKASRNFTLDNILNMRAGHSFYDGAGRGDLPTIWGSMDVAKYAVNAREYKEYQGAPGRFVYSTPNNHVLSRELRLSFEEGSQGLEDYAAYAWEKIFSKVGATSFTCEADMAGTILYGSHCMATALDYLKIGQLVLQRGRWGNEQVVPEAYIDYVSRTSYWQGEPFWPAGLPAANVSELYDEWYTHGWYRLDSLYSCNFMLVGARGVGDQMIYIVPEQDLVVARFGHSGTKSFSLINPASPLMVLLQKLNPSYKCLTPERSEEQSVKSVGLESPRWR